MQAIAVFAALFLIGAGFVKGGPLGALTGFVAAVGAGSGLAVWLGERGTGVDAASSKTGRAQRAIGLYVAVGVAWGIYHGGWRWGWMWALAGSAGGATIGVALAFASGALRGGRNTHDSSDLLFPPTYDLADPLHVLLIDRIREGYATELERPLDYRDCMYKPASQLPFPKVEIRKALSALLMFARGESNSDLVDRSLRSPAVATNIETVLVLLDHYVDLSPEVLPRDPRTNLLVGGSKVDSGSG